MIETIGKWKQAVARRVNPTPGESHMIDGPFVQALAEHGYGDHTYQFRRHVLFDGIDGTTSSVQRETLRLIKARLARNKDNVPVELQDDIECISYIMTAFAVMGHVYGRDSHGVDVSITSHAGYEMFIDDKDSEEDPVERIMDMSERMREVGLIRHEPYRRGVLAYLTPKADALLAR